MFEPHRISPGLVCAQVESNTLCFGTGAAFGTGLSCSITEQHCHVVNSSYTDDRGCESLTVWRQLWQVCGQQAARWQSLSGDHTRFAG